MGNECRDDGTADSEHGADAEIDSPRQDDEGHAQGQQPIDRHDPNDVEQIGPGKKYGREDGEGYAGTAKPQEDGMLAKEGQNGLGR